MITQLDCSEVHVNDDTITAQTWLQAQLPFLDRSILRRQEYNAYNCAQSKYAVLPNESKVDSKGSNSSR